MEDATNMTAQQQARIAKLLALDVEDLAKIMDQLQAAGNQITPSLQKLFQQLDEKAIEFASENWKEQAEEAKAALSTERINSEQRAQQSEAKINAFKSQLTITRQKLQTETKQKLEAEAKSAEYESRVKSQQSGTLHTGVELDHLKSRVETLEAEKRDALAAHERKVTELDQMNEDYRNLMNNHQEIKKEASKNETEARESRSSEMSHKLQQQALKQELDMLKQRIEWTKSELEAKSTELTTYRNDKSAQVLKLQSELDQARLEATTSAQSNTNLQRRLKDLQDKLDESLVKSSEQQEKILTQEEQFRGEMETQRRLADLYQRSSKDATERVAEVEQNMLELQEALARKDVDYSENITEARLDKLGVSHIRHPYVAEQKVQLQMDLEYAKQEIERLKAEQKRADELLEKAGLTESSSEIGRMGVLSPTAAVVGRMQKTGMSLTQVYSRYMDLQAEHFTLKTENSSLKEAMADIVKELADGAPLIQEQRNECLRMKLHAEELSAQLEAAMQEKDQIAHGAREVLARLDGLTKERDDLSKENHDLDRQVHNLLWRLKAPNAPQALAPESTRSVYSENATDAERIIEDHFVLFSDIQELQKQNKKLREVARELTKERTDAEEAKERARTEEEQNVIQEAKRQIESMREEIGSKDMQLSAYKTQTEMQRRLLEAHNIKHKEAADKETKSSAPAVDAVQTSEGLEYAKLLGEVQKAYDNYRHETTVDTRYLKEQLAQVQTENSECRIKLGRAQAQVELLEQRYQLATENSNHQTTEMSELRKRCSFLQDAATRHEITNHRLSSDLTTERDTASRLASEIGNLKQEQALSKALETRFRDDIDSLVKEKGHLNSLLQSVQNMANETERSSEQVKRRLEVAVTSREQEVETLKEKLKEEIESSKRLRDRKDIEAKEWQSRIDNLNKEHQSVRESLIQSKTSLDYSNAKVEDLTKQLKSREDQLAIYQQKPSGSESSEATPEEKLQAQVSQLRAELARHQAEADASREHVAQFQAISQTNEDRLAEITSTFEEFKKEHEEAIARSNENVNNLESKLSAAEERAQSAASNLIEMQNKADAERNDWKAEKAVLDERIRSLEGVESQMKEIEAQYRADILEHSSSAARAHEDYQRELLNHARDMEALSNLKQTHARQAAELTKYKASAESAIANLQSAEISWESQKSVLQKTLSEVEKRCSELKDQNEKLHLHLEDVNAKANSLQRLNAPAPIADLAEGVTSEAEGTPKGSVEHQMAELRDVIRYVRREKEILECQHELNLQESRRLKQQVEETNRSLEETRTLLTKERTKQQDAMVSKEKHEEILEKINQINLLRESNTMLRSENDRLQKLVTELEERNRELQSTLDPLNQQVREMTVDLETSKEELKQLGEDRDRWRTRTHDIMAKHDRIDPTEFQELKDAVEKYKVEVAENIAAANAAKAENEATLAKMQEVGARTNKMASHAQAWRKKHQEEAVKVAELQKELEATKARVPELEKSLEEANKGSSNNAAVQREKENLQRTLDTVQKAKDALTSEKAELEKSLDAYKSKMAISVERNRQLNRRLKEAEAKLASGDSGNGGDPQAIEAAVKAKEAELEKKHAAEKAALEKTISEQSQVANGAPDAAAVAKIAELQKQANSHNMAEMRSRIMLQTKDKEINQLKSQLALLGGQVGNGTTNQTASPTLAAPTTPPGSALSAAAPAFTPQTPRPPIRVRPTGTNAPPLALAPALTAAAGPGVRPRPTPPTLNAGPGQQRLRPPLSARNAAAAAAAAGTGAVVSPATASPLATTPAPATPALTANPSRGRMIKRRREDELPMGIPQANTAQGSAPTQEAPSSTTTATPPVADTNAKTTLIKRQRPLPVIEPQQVAAVTESSPAAFPSADSPVNTTTITSTVTAVRSSTTSSPHGQKRRLEATESVQENITIVSTPNPADLEDMDEAPTAEQEESSAMDVDDAPPVKRIRPTSHVVITEVSEDSNGDLPGTPGAHLDEEEEDTTIHEEPSAQDDAQEEGEMPEEPQSEAETSNDASISAPEASTGPEEAAASSIEEQDSRDLEEEGDEGEHIEGDLEAEQDAQESSVQEPAQEPAQEEDLGMAVDAGYGTPDPLLADEDFDVQTPLGGHDDEEDEGEEAGDFELDMDAHHNRGQETEGEPEAQ
ncbi:hypothetical protein BG005_010401 [Podila minutissima]|nr:hypothetical protein BG005_010401 [Podila minutissima]